MVEENVGGRDLDTNLNNESIDEELQKNDEVKDQETDKNDEVKEEVVPEFTPGQQEMVNDLIQDFEREMWAKVLTYSANFVRKFPIKGARGDANHARRISTALMDEAKKFNS